MAKDPRQQTFADLVHEPTWSETDASQMYKPPPPAFFLRGRFLLVFVFLWGSPPGGAPVTGGRLCYCVGGGGPPHGMPAGKVA